MYSSYTWYNGSSIISSINSGSYIQDVNFVCNVTSIGSDQAYLSVNYLCITYNYTYNCSTPSPIGLSAIAGPGG